jgi:hypothetical protein
MRLSTGVAQKKYFHIYIYIYIYIYISHTRVYEAEGVKAD